MKGKVFFLVILAITTFFQLGVFTGCDAAATTTTTTTTTLAPKDYFYSYSPKLANDSLSDFEAQNGAKWIISGDELEKGEYNVYLLADAATADPMTTTIWGTKMVKMIKNSSTGLFEVTLEKSKTTYAEWGTPEEFLNTKVAVVKSTDVDQFENDPTTIPFYTFQKGIGTLAVEYAKLERDKATKFKVYNNGLTDTEYEVLTITLK